MESHKQKIALGLVIKNEQDYIPQGVILSMSKYIKSYIDKVFVVDNESSDDTIAIIQNGFFGKEVEVSRMFGYDMASFRNQLIDIAQVQGFNWMIQLDADEFIRESDFAKIIKYIYSIEEECISLPRIEFIDDKNHFDPTLYPDKQLRIFKLNTGFEFRNRVHELLYKKDHGQSAFEEKIDVFIPDVNIYHFSRIKDKRSLWKKYNNYNRLTEGKDPDNSIEPSEEQLNSMKYFDRKVPFIW